MTPLGNNILVRPDARRLVVNGIHIPETATPSAQEWGTVVAGNEEIREGSRILYFGRKAFEKDGLKFINVKKVLIWDC